MKGRFGDRVEHSPTGKRGKIFMNRGEILSIGSTAVDLDDGTHRQFPDAELQILRPDGSVPTGVMRFSSHRPIPDGMVVQFQNHDDGTVTITGQLPGTPAITVHHLPIRDGEVVIPDELFFPMNG